MRYVGIDIGSDKHTVAVVDGEGAVVHRSKDFAEDLDGYQSLFELLQTPENTLIAMEATGHYWQNLFATLAANGYAVVLLNPIQTRRFADGELSRTKTDKIDATMIARYASQKRPAPTPMPDEATLELRELVRMRDRYVQDLGDRVRQLHRVVDLGFPEFTRHVKDLDTQLATTLLRQYPTAPDFAKQSPKRLGKLVYDGRHHVGEELAKELVSAAKTSVGRHHGPSFRMQVEDNCEDIDVLRRRIKRLESDINSTLGKHEIGKLLLTIDGIGETTAARIVGEVGDPSVFRCAAAFAAYVGVVPGLKQSGKRQSQRAGLAPIGHKDLRAKLWMPVLTAVRRNAWLKVFYDRLIARGKLPKVALVAAMHKLLAAIYSVAKNRKAFVPILPTVTVSLQNCTEGS
jgi:transposase